MFYVNRILCAIVLLVLINGTAAVAEPLFPMEVGDRWDFSCTDNINNQWMFSRSVLIF